MARLVLVFALVAALPALGPSREARANPVECGANAFTYVEVDKKPPGKRRRGPVVVRPDFVCADLIEVRPRQIDSIEVTVDPRGELPTDPSFRGAPKVRARSP